MCLTAVVNVSKVDDVLHAGAIALFQLLVDPLRDLARERQAGAPVTEYKKPQRQLGARGFGLRWRFVEGTDAAHECSELGAGTIQSVVDVSTVPRPAFDERGTPHAFGLAHFFQTALR